MNRRLFLAALVSLVSAKLFPQRAAAKQFDFSNGTTRVDGKFISCSITNSPDSWDVNQWQGGQIRIERDSPPDDFRWGVRHIGPVPEFTISV